MIGENQEQENPTLREQELLINELPVYFNKIEKILRGYIDMQEENYPLVSLWIVGTYLHKQFSSYPYLFFNAMKGSGKTRMLKIISNLSKNGNILNSLTEAVLFRTAYNRTLCIDEFENVNAKGQENLGLLLNSAYKRGCDVERMIKKKTMAGEVQEVQRFKVYCPLAIANIKGMENVLADRCISIVLERSIDPRYTKLIENFENDDNFIDIRNGLNRVTGILGDDLNHFGGMIQKWNNLHINEELRTFEVPDSKYNELFIAIEKTDIKNRDLELFFPLFIIADICGVLDKIIQIALKTTSDKRQQDREENMDIKIYEFVAQYKVEGFVPISTICNDFKAYSELHDDWICPRWLSKGLRRLNLVIEKKRTSKTNAVVLDTLRAIRLYTHFSS